MVELIKICGVAILATFCAVILKSFRGEYAALVRVAGVTVIFGVSVLGVRSLFSDISEIVYQESVEPYVTLLLKSLGIGIVTRICSEVCRDSGEGTIGSYVEIGGKVEIVLLTLPMIKKIIDLAVGMI